MKEDVRVNYLFMAPRISGFRGESQDLRLFLLKTKGFTGWQHFFFNRSPANTETDPQRDIGRTLVQHLYLNSQTESFPIMDVHLPPFLRRIGTNT